MGRRERTQFDYDVFLSHCSEDKPVVLPLAERLRADGLRVWPDDWRIDPGASISGAISDGLENSRVLLMLLSEHFDKSDWTHFEGAPFLFSDPRNRNRQFIPVRLDDAEIPFRLKDFAWVDWRTGEETQYQRLLSACRSDDESSGRRETSDPPGTELSRVRLPDEPPAPRPPTPFSLGHTEQINSVAISADGARAISGSYDDTLRVWDLATGQCTAILEAPGSGDVNAVALTADGTRGLRL